MEKILLEEMRQWKVCNYSEFHSITLLDGNKAPSRIDPFGSTARKMENYLLHDNHEDRLHHLHMEFNSRRSNLYITIGMGMRAPKI